ncbi:hypothetical protein [Agromyces sp. NPDC056965]|uniref:DUF7657 domain-containing protein n=1 Tax=Agromyces sp. NPDC056965 TaxID=3345983 RepID=UPI00362C81AC
MVLIPLAVLLGLLVTLVALGLTGSSSGILHQFVASGPDDRLVAGEPQAIRSDEWFVQSSWAVSQVEQGLPARNESFPGGMDATVQHDLPALDWSLVLRPHLWGFAFLPLDNAMALKWWFPAVSMIAACYLFAVTMLPRRPFAAAAIAVAFFFAPFFQWWFLSITFYAPAWAFLLMAAIVWILRGTSRRSEWILACLLGYGVAVVGTTIYAPFIIAATWPAVAFAIGYTLTRDSSPLIGLWPRLKRLRWLLLGTLAGVAVLAVWVITRWSTIESFTSTVYPGERLQLVGQSGRADLFSILAGVFSPGLEDANGLPLGMNASEASTYLLVGAFLALPLAWLLVRTCRSSPRQVDWLIVALLGLGALFLAYLFVPGWDALAHLLLLDRTTTGRLRMGLGVLALVMTIVLANRLDRSHPTAPERVPVWVPLVTTGLAALVNGALAVWLLRMNSPIMSDLVWVPVLAAFLAAVWFFSSGRATAGATAFLIASVLAGAMVNPLYRGVYDLNETELVSEMKRVNEDGATWVGIGDSPIATVALVESGLRSFNGFQSSPSEEMWNEIDPSGSAELTWNRLANVSWEPGDGAPNPTNPAPDQIRLTFDSCDSFAQENVDFVLSERPLEQDCVDLVDTVRQGPAEFRIYEVEPRS